MDVDQADLSRETPVVVFHGLEPDKICFPDVYDAAVAWFSNLGFEPTFLTVRRNGAVGAKLGKFAARNTALREQGFDNVTAISMLIRDPDEDGENMIAWTYSAAFNGSIKLINRVSSCRIDGHSMMPVVRHFVELTQPEYGLGYTMLPALGPSFYAGAVGFGTGAPRKLPLKEAEAKRNMHRWGDLGTVDAVWRAGLIRDVYRWNFLNEAQLIRNVDGQSLREWIAATPQRGTLAKFEHGLTLWEVPPESIAEMSKALKKSGNIFHWRSWTNYPIESDPAVAGQLALERASGLWVDD